MSGRFKWRRSAEEMQAQRLRERRPGLTFFNVPNSEEVFASSQRGKPMPIETFPDARKAAEWIRRKAKEGLVTA